MRKNTSDGLWVWLLSAVAFFALVIAYFLGSRVLGRRADASAYRPAAPLTAPAADPGSSALPTAPVRMKVKRIEPRKYRREGELPPPPAVR